MEHRSSERVERMATVLLSLALKGNFSCFSYLVKNLKKSLTCWKDCERLKLAIERPKLQLVRLAKLLDERKQAGQDLVALDEKCRGMEVLLEKAIETVDELNSGRNIYNVVFRAKLATRIEEIGRLIEEKVKEITVLETILATNPLKQGQCPLHQGHCPATNSLQCCHDLRQTPFPGASPQHRASMRHLHTMHSDPLGQHSASDFPGTSHLRHGRSKEAFSNVAHDSCYNAPVLDINQRRNDFDRIKADELRTRAEPYRRHSTTGLHVIDMAYADIPLDFEATTFEVIKECLITLVHGIEAQVVEFPRLHSGNHIRVFNEECDSLVDTLSGTVHRLRRYNNMLSVVQVAGVSDRRRNFMTAAFCIVALAELERMFKAVVDLLTMCSKEDWWSTALELSNTLQSPTIPRWSSFSLAIRSYEWSMDIVDFGFHALEQFLIGASTLTGVVFKWSDKQSRMVLHIDGNPLYYDEGGSSLLDVTGDLEGKDVTALIQKLVDLNETQKRKWLSCFAGNEDTNMHIIADVLSQKLHGPRPDPNSLPYTFEVDPSTLEFVKHIGNGGCGSVAEYKWLGRTVSVKKVKSRGLSRKQFEMEAAILATVQHPRVVRMIGRAFEENEGMGSLVMERMEDDLCQVIEKRCPNPALGVSPFPLVVAIDIMLQIGEGMQYIREHRILHRDLKAKNVLLNRCRTSECSAYEKFPARLASLLHTQEYYIVKLADFGIAKASREQTDFGTMMAGTGSWRAPEVYKAETDHKYEWPADVYSFAMTCYEILTGCIPFDNVPNPELYKRIVAGDRPPLDDVRLPPLLKDLVERCWRTDPNERPNFDEICKTLWQCKVEYILPAFRLQIGHMGHLCDPASTTVLPCSSGATYTR